MASPRSATTRGGGRNGRTDSSQPPVVASGPESNTSLTREQRLELYYWMNERCFEWLDAPVLRVTGHDVPLPYAPSLEDFVLPQTADIVLAARRPAAH